MSVSYQAMRGLANVPWYFPFAQAEIVGSGSAIITASATSHTKGSWVQLIASTTDESSLLFAQATGLETAGAETSMLLDIGVGASGSEVEIVSNVAVGGATNSSGSGQGLSVPLPVRIASGSRIAARCQALIASDTCAFRWSLAKFPGRQVLPTAVDVLGTDTATSRGTAFSGASGSWNEVTASSSQRYRAVWAVASVIGSNVASVSPMILEIGFGAAGSEATVGKVRFSSNVNEAITNSPVWAAHVPIACDIPAGSRIAVKHNISSDPGNYGFCVIGIP